MASAGFAPPWLKRTKEARLSDAKYISRAIELACRAEGFTHPNPLVGCVLVKDGETVAEGWHKGPGQEHAEAMALRLAGDAARGATAYVTLEPCNHYGRTPPCAQALIKAGAAKVVYGAEDPNPLAEGGGTTLRAAGIPAVLSDDAEVRAACADLLRPWLHSLTSDRPWVTAKIAMSLDGFTATSAGESKWITGAEARQHGHRLRLRTGGIAVGVNTVLADDPGLDTRLTDRDALASAKVVFDSKLQTHIRAKIFSTPGDVLLVTHEGASAEREAELTSAGADVIRVAGTDGHPELGQALVALKERGITDLMIEGGGTLMGEAFRQHLVDELWLYTAPVLLGDGRRALGGQGIEALADAYQLEWLENETLGADLFRRALIKKGGH
ncbi:MAG: bifunctional diaminohydroxyphosphoribosylaminopyrimidine deaminase/5-amino-6-(5-phosphoribosylamino)uracil reductase RibD [Parvularculaceae bacterium]|nr:bifunctional diaminohydroxyphosphoribosylaminopyrimidine deaminase/5-amino-6-(5-phosphoribosylamino)uracil reductase RibD [Parvularculaceae bacterium]